MLVNVKTEKRQHTLGCHPSPLLCAVQLNRDKTQTQSMLSVAQEKTCFNFSRGGRIPQVTPTLLDTHYFSNGGTQW